MIDSQNVLSQVGQTVSKRLVNYVEVTQQPVIIRGVGLEPGEEYGIEYSFSGVDKWIPFSPNGAQKKITTLNNPAVVATPGKYRVVPLTGMNNCARFDTIAGTTSHEWLLEYMEPTIITGGGGGTEGPPGIPGAPGSVWFVNFGAPSVEFGVNGDFYLNRINGDYYTKLAGVWILQGNLTGPAGSSESGANLPFPYPPIIAGQYVSAQIFPGQNQSSVNMGILQNALTFIPFIAAKNFSVGAMRLDITTGVGAGAFILGLYDSDGVGAFYPGSRLGSTGVLNGGVTSIQEGSFSSPVTLTRGHFYWMAISSNNESFGVKTLSQNDESTLNLGLINGSALASRILVQPIGSGTVPSALPVTASASASDRSSFPQVPYVLLKAS